MPRVTIRIGARERINPTISKATLLLPTDALVWIGTTSIAGTATAMRALADALTEAAETGRRLRRRPRRLQPARARAGRACRRGLTAASVPPSAGCARPSAPSRSSPSTPARSRWSRPARPWPANSSPSPSPSRQRLGAGSITPSSGRRALSDPWTT